MPTHAILGGKVRLYRRGEADSWHASTHHQGKEHRKGTKTDVLSLAEEKAEDWYSARQRISASLQDSGMRRRPWLVRFRPCRGQN